MTHALKTIPQDTAYIHKIRSIDTAYEPGAYFYGQSRPDPICRQRSNAHV